MRAWVRQYPNVAVVLSCHNLRETPPDLPRLLVKMAAWPARRFKIVTRAECWGDVLRLRLLLDEAKRRGVPLTAYATGPFGVPSRMLALLGGTCWMYLSQGAPLVPGMISRWAWNRVYRAGRAGSRSQVYGVAGNPVAHSLSPPLHNWLFEASGRADLYVPLPVPDLEDFRSVLPALGLAGLSVTVPYKESVRPWCGSVSEEAARIGAVNTLVPAGGGWRGENTDWSGFQQSLSGFVPPERRRFLVLGAGGAARAVVYALLRRGAEVWVWNRGPERLARLRQAFPMIRPAVSGAAHDVDVVVNTVPWNRQGECACEGFDWDGVRAALAMDLNYGGEPGSFLSLAREHGWPCRDGFAMLFYQALEQQALWTGRRPMVRLEEAEALRGEWSRARQADGAGSSSE